MCISFFWSSTAKLASKFNIGCVIEHYSDHRCIAIVHKINSNWLSIKRNLLYTSQMWKTVIVLCYFMLWHFKSWNFRYRSILSLRFIELYALPSIGMITIVEFSISHLYSDTVIIIRHLIELPRLSWLFAIT